MPVYKVKNFKEFENLARRFRSLFLVVYGEEVANDKGKLEYIEKLVNELIYCFPPDIPLIIVDLNMVPEARERLGVESTPSLAFMLNGKIIWRQYGLFYAIIYDKQAIRIGLRETLEQYGYRLRDLGIRFI